MLFRTTILCFTGAIVPSYGFTIPTGSAPSKWVHPEAMISQSQLDFICDKVNNNEQPWKNAYTAMLSDIAIAKDLYPPAIIQCGPYSDPDVGCDAEREDLISAYGNALAWAISGTQSYAQQAIKIMDTYSATVKDAGWTETGIGQFESMLRDVYMPLTVDGTDHNVANWELVMTEAAIIMAVFLEDATSYNAAMGWHLKRVPATVYMNNDGEYPVAARGQSSSPDGIIAWWFDEDTFQEDGQAQETCRDLEHTGYSFASMAHVAEAARIQGTDLYKTDLGTRLQKGLGFHSNLANGAAVPSWLCGGKLSLTLGPITEVGYNALSFRNGVDMPHTEKLTINQRPAKNNGLFVAYETLTHAENNA
ncbi:hypothetical protein PENVUL_c003G03176 [Penicillium vulpinum]|uniref:Alginate lyase domain-containing protein n=1 Tax=Penicillium vulpinum TaxID=29845 RepID=A0A1V6SAF6_9EURO|nr:hypothetical protein PENVUL_c003G03176 [Penicillium vulpinum]